MKSTTTKEREFMVSIYYKVEGEDFPINRELDNELGDFFKEEFDMERSGSGSGFGGRDVEFISSTKFEISDNTPPPFDMDFIEKSIESMVKKYNVTLEEINGWWYMTEEDYQKLYEPQLELELENKY